MDEIRSYNYHKIRVRPSMTALFLPLTLYLYIYRGRERCEKAIGRLTKITYKHGNSETPCCPGACMSRKEETEKNKFSLLISKMFFILFLNWKLMYIKSCNIYSIWYLESESKFLGMQNVSELRDCICTCCIVLTAYTRQICRRSSQNQYYNLIITSPHLTFIADI